jgi:hypothetical protein
VLDSIAFCTGLWVSSCATVKCGPVLLSRRVMLGLKQGPLPCRMVWSIWLLRAATSRLYAQWLHTMRQLSDGQCVPAKELSWPLRAFIAC